MEILQQQAERQKAKEAYKNKDFHTMPTKEKWELIYLMLKDHGYID